MSMQRCAVHDKPAAGKPIPRGTGAKECLLQPTDQPPTPERIRRLHLASQPEPGMSRLLSEQRPSDIRHGVSSKDSLNVSQLVNPEKQTAFQQQLLLAQEAVYASKNRAPLGSSHNQQPGLPAGFSPVNTTFGTPNLKGDSAGELVSPAKSALQVEQEELQGKEVYLLSHGKCNVGEMADRKYDWSKFTKDSLYGVPTPHDNTGSGVRNALHWLTLAQQEKRVQLVTKQLDDFRERTQSKVGQSLDPMADTRTVEDDHAFGVTIRPDEFSVGDLTCMTGPSVYLHCIGFSPGLLASIRRHLKKYNFSNFSGLLESLEKIDKAQQQDGVLGGLLGHRDVLDKFGQFRLPLEPEMTHLLLAWTSSGLDDQRVRYRWLVELMDWHQQVSQELVQIMEEQAQGVSMAEDDPRHLVIKNGYHTSSQEISASPQAVSTHSHRPSGVPTIRTDIPPPRIKRVSDHANYGDESDAYGLMYPSLYSNRGLYEQDFFMPRAPEQIRGIFSTMGVPLTDDVFQLAWQKASGADPQGQVCVESFRAVLEAMLANQEPTV